MSFSLSIKFTYDSDGFVVFNRGVEDYQDGCSHSTTALACNNESPIKSNIAMGKVVDYTRNRAGRHVSHCNGCTCEKCKANLKRKPRSDSVKHFCKYKLTCDKALIQYIFQMSGLTPTVDTDFSIIWHSASTRFSDYQRIHKNQKINIFPKSWELTRKDLFSRNIKAMIEAHGKKSFSFVPESFVLPEDMKLIELIFEDNTKPWIVKPASSSQGNGIYLTDCIEELPHRNPLAALSLGNNPSNSPPHWVIQRYIANPLLLDSRKFDLRLYVAVTSFSPLKIYLHDEGLVRLASEPYSSDRESFSDRFAHLTNYSVNKTNARHRHQTDIPPNEDKDAVDGATETPVEGKQDGEAVDTSARGAVPVPGDVVTDGQAVEGIKMRLSDLWTRLSSRGVDVSALRNRIDDVVVKAILAVEAKVAWAESQCCVPGTCFQLFGFDVLVDEELQPWLLEVNLSPSLHTDTPLDLAVKSAVLTDLFNLVGVRPLKSPATPSSHTHTRTHAISPSTRRKKNGSKQEKPAAATVSDSTLKDSRHTSQSDAVEDADIAPDDDLSHSGVIDGPYFPSVQVPVSADISPREGPSSQHKSVYRVSRITKTSSVTTFQSLQRAHFRDIADADRAALLSFCKESDRGGGFAVIFPNSDYFIHYRRYFNGERPLNDLLGRFMVLRKQLLQKAFSADKSDRKDVIQPKCVLSSDNPLSLAKTLSASGQTLSRPHNGVRPKSSSAYCGSKTKRELNEKIRLADEINNAVQRNFISVVPNICTKQLDTNSEKRFIS